MSDDLGSLLKHHCHEMKQDAHKSTILLFDVDMLILQAPCLLLLSAHTAGTHGKVIMILCFTRPFTFRACVLLHAVHTVL